jgi:murein DD-endopeptidase MepM/ murein hydrolase activator NlpD
MAAPHVPDMLYEGNRVFGANDPSIKAIGIHELEQQDLATEAIEDDASPSQEPEVVWAEVSDTSTSRKRARKRPKLALEVSNPSNLSCGISLSLCAAAEPRLLQSGALLDHGFLCRPCPQEDATPNLPAGMGTNIQFVTIAASVPPRTNARLCCCAADADSLPGFVYISSLEVPHPNPSDWHGIVLGLPLAGIAGETWLCTQGFGGAGHHRGASMHHSVDFECDQGTAIIAVGDGVILEAIDTRRLGAGHVDLLPEANVLKLQLDSGSYVACYLHLETGSALVKAGDRVKLGDRLASTGNVGFTTGPHLHFQLNTGPEEEDSTLMYGFRDDVRSCVVPVAGYSFGSSGLNPLKLASTVEPASLDEKLPLGALDCLRNGFHGDLAATEKLLADALLWLRVSPVPAAAGTLEKGKDEAQLQEEDVDQALRAYPSEHTCLVCNVVALESMLKEGRESRFVCRGSIPPCYLSCACNFDRDTDTGEIFSYEIAICEHQERCQEEAKQESEVSFCLDPKWRCDWLGYFKQKLSLRKEHEVYFGDAFVRNQAGARPLGKDEEALPVHTLRRTSLVSFEADAKTSKVGSLGRAGCVVAFRHEDVSSEPFGMWFGWMVCGEHFFVLDLQNSRITSTLDASIHGLSWSQPARPEVFYAPFK